MSKATLTIDIGHASAAGVKPDNEDFFGALIASGSQLIHKGIAVAIADGMSGSDAGKQASHCCVASFLSDYYSTPDSWSVKQAGQKILSATNSWLYSQGQIRYQSTRGMVSTLSILVLKSTTAHIFHIGDSRIYRLRDGVLEQLTRDHRVWLANDKNYLNRAMGIEPRLEIDYKTLSLAQDDVFLLTTDGIHDFVTDKQIKTALEQPLSLTEMAQQLLDTALAQHSDDNLTCQVIKITQIPNAKEDEILTQHENLPFPPPLSPGQVLDGFRIEQELHASKRTQIYRAFDTRTQTTVILKTPSVLFDDDTLYIEHFLHEEWAGKRIDNPHVLKVLPTDREKSCIYYVTEYLTGPTLREWMDAHPKPNIDTVRNIIQQIAKGLRAFHRMEMLHQDLKPENIMFDASGAVKIIDFGSVKIAGIAEIVPNIGDDTILGTLNYSAPEYHLGQRGSVRSDLFSLAVIMYEMLNNTLPFGPAMTTRADAMKLAKLRYTPSIHHNPMVPIWIDGALQKATALNPQLRYNDLSEFLYDLTTPNHAFFSSKEAIPLLERNPLWFWQGVSLLLLVVNIVLVYQLVKGD